MILEQNCPANRGASFSAETKLRARHCRGRPARVRLRTSGRMLFWIGRESLAQARGFPFLDPPRYTCHDLAPFAAGANPGPAEVCLPAGPLMCRPPWKDPHASEAHTG
jgi:hypothetical protein